MSAAVGPTVGDPGRGDHPARHLDDVVHQRVRLGILSVLVEVERAEFTYLRQVLELSDGNLGRHLQVLVDAGYVELHKDTTAKRPRTWAALTDDGRLAFAREVEALERIVGGRPPATDKGRTRP